MPSLFSFAVRAFVLSLLCSVVLSREKQSRARRLEDIIQKGQSVDKRDICIEDDTLISFQHWIVDSAGYCSSLLSIVDFTQTLPRISRT